jgi:hypothetical protein
MSIKPEEIVPDYDTSIASNPWAVDSLRKFLFYNCPECDFKAKDEPSFQNHAVELHNKVQFSIDESTHIMLRELPSVSNTVKKNFTVDGKNGFFSNLKTGNLPVKICFGEKAKNVVKSII